MLALAAGAGRMKAFSDFVVGLSSLLWPIFAFVALFVFRNEIKDLLRQLGKLNRGKFLGMELEFRDTLKHDSSSEILRAYLWPGGKYDDGRRKTLNVFLRQLGCGLINTQP